MANSIMLDKAKALAKFKNNILLPFFIFCIDKCVKIEYNIYENGVPGP